MQRIDQIFLTLAAICLIAGVCLGIGMGMAQDFHLAPVHAHLNLVGFVSLAVFGIVYKLYPELARSHLAALHLAASAVSGVTFPAGVYIAVAHGVEGPVIVAALLWLAGAVLFLANLLRVFVGADRSAAPAAALAAGR